jgi:Transposase IS66 family
MARDDRPLDGGYPPAVAFNYVPGRRYAQAKAPLRACRGVPRCDGYYKKLVRPRSAQPSITLAFCWSHLRRGIYCLAKMNAPVVTEVKRIDAPALPRFGLSSSQTNSSRFQRLQRAAHAMTGY